jgi:hypothetical protein
MAAGDSLLLDGVDDFLDFTAGGLGGVLTACSMLAVIKRLDDTTFDGVFYGGPTSTKSKVGFSVRDTDVLYSDTVVTGGWAAGAGAGASGTSTTGVLTANGWVICGVTKAAGSDTPRYHKYNFGTTTWTHENGDTDMGDTTGSINQYFAGAWKDTIGDPDDFFNGNLGLIAVWKSDLGSDGAVEAAISNELLLADWVAAAPDELLRFDRTSAITSLTGSMTENLRVGTTLDTGDMPSGWSDALAGAGPPSKNPDFREFPRYLLAGRKTV